MCHADPKLPRFLVGRSEMDPEQDAGVDDLLSGREKLSKKRSGLAAWAGILFTENSMSSVPKNSRNAPVNAPVRPFAPDT